MLSASEVAALTDRPQKTSKGWQCRCPAHQDRVRSLTIWDDDEGKTALHCFAGCEWSDVINALGIDWQDTRPDKDKVHGTSSIVKEYHYKNEDGSIRYAKVRYEPKGFTIPGGCGPLGPTIYRLPEVVAAKADRTIFYAEGEKDVETLEALGLVATTAGGANNWKSEFAAHFAGAIRVIILPDNDEPGMKLAQRVLEDVSKVAKDASILEFPGMPYKGDVSDWVASGGTRMELERLVNISSSGLKLMDASAIADIQAPIMKFAVEGLVPVGLTLLAGAPKTGKSILALELTHSVATGKQALNAHRSHPGRTIYVSLEDPAWVTKDRMGRTYGEVPRGWYLTNDSPGDIRRNDWKTLSKSVKAVGDVRMVVIDTLNAMRDTTSGKGSTSVYYDDAAFAKRMHEWALSNGVALVVIHHTKKGDSADVLDEVSGSKGLTGSADAILIFKRERFADNGELLVLGRTMMDTRIKLRSTATQRWVVDTPADNVVPFKQSEIL